MTDVLRDVIRQNRSGQPAAIPSVCSAHEDVIAASLALAERLDRAIVIEATSNQVNQDGGYTGLRAAGFIDMVHIIADREGVDRDRIVFGGDHLGPQAWRSLNAEAALDKAKALMSDYVTAGFSKIHIDCSEGCADEPAQVSDSVASSRSALLAEICESAAPDPSALLYVIGTEVPPPGGARMDDQGDIAATDPDAARATLEAHRLAFRSAGLTEALGRIGALVVQPGVEFSPMHVHHLSPDRNPGLIDATEGWEICLEAHSTDYQRPETYPHLAELGFAFQKVGPALTFAWRQAIYALDSLREMSGWGRRQVQPVMEALMLAEPRHWQGHYHGSEEDRRIARHFGLADRIRYYWSHPEAQAAVAELLGGLDGKRLPEPLLWQVFDRTTLELLDTAPTPRALVRAEIQRALTPYFF